MGYIHTFIAVASDTRATRGSQPPTRVGATIANMEFDLLQNHAYEWTQEDVQFAVHVQRAGISGSRLEKEREILWQAFFARPMACMRTSALVRTYGWGLHFDGADKIALVAMESPRYQQLLHDSSLHHTQGMRSKRAAT